MSSLVRYTFQKNERLTHKPTINKIFQTKGQRLSAFPLSLIFMECQREEDVPAQILISVPKKRIRRAVQRNLIKRRIRESYRMQKHLLFDSIGNEKQFALAIVYLPTEPHTYKSINKAVKKLIHDFSTRIS